MQDKNYSTEIQDPTVAINFCKFLIYTEKNHGTPLW
jgi:hypothetical protein